MGITRPFLRDMPSEWIGSRIVLRRWRDEDAQPLFDAIMESQGRLRQWMPKGPSISQSWADTYHSVDDAIEFVRRQSGHWALHEHIGLGIFAEETGTLLGSIGMRVNDTKLLIVELGYWIRTSAEGQGYVSEAARQVTMFAFEGLGAQRVQIRCDARNQRSKAVPERLGFLFEGCHRRDSLGTDGTIRDTLVYAMIPEDFARVRETWE